MSDKGDDFYSIVCNQCIIKFAISKEAEQAWRKSGQWFHCPNGHQMRWTKPDPEVEQLRKEVADLKDKLSLANKTIDEQKAHIKTLSLEVAIWKPEGAGDGECGVLFGIAELPCPLPKGHDGEHSHTRKENRKSK